MSLHERLFLLLECLFVKSHLLVVPASVAGSGRFAAFGIAGLPESARWGVTPLSLKTDSGT